MSGQTIQFWVFIIGGSFVAGLMSGLLFIREARRLRRREMRELRNEFVSLASHQMRTPLTKIRWQLDQMVDEGALKKDQEQAVREVLQHVDNLTELIHDLLDVSRLETGQMHVRRVEADLENLVHGVIEEVEVKKRGSKDGIRLVNRLPRQMVLIDPNLVRQVVLSFLTNAVRYSRPEHGVITVTLHASDFGYRVAVEDHGIGVPKDAQKKIFEKGYRADNAVRMTSDGTGLGLYLAKKLIEALGGKIGFITKEGEGSTFWIELPR